MLSLPGRCNHQAVAFGAIWIALGYASAVCSCRPSPMLFGYLGAADARVPGWRSLVKAFAAVSSVVCMSGGFRKLLALVYLAAFSNLAWYQLRWMPYSSRFTNCVQSALLSVLFWGSSVLVIRTFNGSARARRCSVAHISPDVSCALIDFSSRLQVSPKAATSAVLVGSPIVAVIGGAITYARLRRIRRTVGARYVGAHSFCSHFNSLPLLISELQF